MTVADKQAYTHILYLKPSPETVVAQVAKDSTKQRDQLDVAAVRNWQDFEEVHLYYTCRDNDILFMTIGPKMLNQTAAIVEMLEDAAYHDEVTNGALVNNALDEILQPSSMSDVKTMLVLDADHTLAPYDASTLYWELSNGETNPLSSKNCSRAP